MEGEKKGADLEVKGGKGKKGAVEANPRAVDGWPPDGDNKTKDMSSQGNVERRSTGERLDVVTRRDKPLSNFLRSPECVSAKEETPSHWVTQQSQLKTKLCGSCQTQCCCSDHGKSGPKQG